MTDKYHVLNYDDYSHRMQADGGIAAYEKIIMQHRYVHYGIIFIAFLLVASALHAQDVGQGAVEQYISTSFREKLNREVRIMYIARPESVDLNHLWNIIQQQDQQYPQILEHSVRPTRLTDTDAVVYFLDKWEDILIVPGNENFTDKMREMAHNENTNIVSMKFAEANGRPFAFIFINLNGSIGHVSSECYAQTILSMLSEEFENLEIPLYSCSQSN